MAWTKAWDGNFITLIPDGANNFVWTTEYPEWPQGVRVASIQVVFSAANDKVVIRTHKTTGAEIMNVTTLDGSTKMKSFDPAPLVKPVILHAQQTYNTPANWRIILHVV